MGVTGCRDCNKEVQSWGPSRGSPDTRLLNMAFLNTWSSNTHCKI